MIASDYRFSAGGRKPIRSLALFSTRARPIRNTVKEDRCERNEMDGICQKSGFW